MIYEVKKEIQEGINQLCKENFYVCEDKGFWSDPRTFPHCFFMIVTELAECLNAFEKSGEQPAKDKHLPHRDAIEVELADAVLRIFDLAGAMDMDLGGAIAEKFAYNQTRPYKHGKKF